MEGLLNVIKTILTWIISLLGKSPAPESEPTIARPSDVLQYVRDPEAIAKAIKYLDQNQAAYYAGKQIWPRGMINNKFYNNVLLIEEPEYMRIYRLYQEGIQKYIDYGPLTKSEYDSIGRENWITYCNLALSVFYTFFVQDSRGTLQNYDGGQHDANSVCVNVFNGLYECNGNTFKECDLNAAKLYAGDGAFVICLFKNPVGWGHVAAMVDKQGTIYQAGKDFGRMTLAEGFTAQFVPKIRYFYWGKKL